MALAAYTPQPHKFNRFNKNRLFDRDTDSHIPTTPLSVGTDCENCAASKCHCFVCRFQF
jgi:hypothetical protein